MNGEAMELTIPSEYIESLLKRLYKSEAEVERLSRSNSQVKAWAVRDSVTQDLKISLRLSSDLLAHCGKDARYCVVEAVLNALRQNGIKL